jgi:hypothetical protein
VVETMVAMTRAHCSVAAFAVWMRFGAPKASFGPIY